jgi:RNA ligase (TIGR02306 family)
MGWMRWAVLSVWLYLFGPKPLKPPRLRFTPDTYDIEPFRKYGRHWFEENELVVVTEKIHGQNASFVHDGKQLHVKSRMRWWRNDPTEHQNTWARVAKRYGLEAKLAKKPGLILFGETYGNNTDMPYGVTPEERQNEGDRFAAFDAFDSTTGQWLGFYEFRDLCTELDIPRVPVIASLVWGPDSYDALLPFAEGETWLNKGEHIREGFVVKPVNERRTSFGQRVILKMAGESYLTRKAA